jgi:hypothetical protein
MEAIILVRKDIPPKVRKPGGTGRDPEFWENHLAPAKEGDNAGQSFVVSEHPSKGSATNRITGMKKRLRTAVPDQWWDFDYGQDSETEKWEVFVTYKGIYTSEQIAANAVKHQAAIERGQKNAAKNAANRAAAAANGDSKAEESSTSTAKERVRPKASQSSK